MRMPWHRRYRHRSQSTKPSKYTTYALYFPYPLCCSWLIWPKQNDAKNLKKVMIQMHNSKYRTCLGTDWEGTGARIIPVLRHIMKYGIIFKEEININTNSILNNFPIFYSHLWDICDYLCDRHQMALIICIGQRSKMHSMYVFNQLFFWISL